MINLIECADLLRSKDNILIVTHKRPDGDTLGSAAALCSALRRIGKTAYLYNNNGVTKRYLKYVEEYFAPSGFAHDYIVAVDVADVTMLAEGFSEKIELCIDHHPTNAHYADELLLCAHKASCGEAIFELIKELCGSVTPHEANLLYIAVSTDCGCFRYANTTSETLLAASELAAAGADIQRLNFELFRQVTKARMVLEGLICSSLGFAKDGKVVAAVITLDMIDKAQATEDDCDDIAGIPGRVEGCVVSIIIRQLDENVCKVSLRSQPCFDCSSVCAAFGGGGHKMASGCTVNKSPEETKEIMIKAVLDAWDTAE